jgi:hypothetical protein
VFSWFGGVDDVRGFSLVNFGTSVFTITSVLFDDKGFPAHIPIIKDYY